MDPLALVVSNPLQTVWLARADLFKSRLARPFLKFLKMLPVYRIRDGKENLSNNDHVFKQVISVLEGGHSVALFPEAAHSGKRQMLPHKKAIPRIALEAEAKHGFNLGLMIVPVGIFYDHYWKFNRTLIVKYGEPIAIDAYKDMYAENPGGAMLALRDEILQNIVPLVLDIKSEQHYEVYEQARVVAETEFSKPTADPDPDIQKFEAARRVVARMEALEDTDPSRFDRIVDQVEKYSGQLRNADITDLVVSACRKLGFSEVLKDFFLAFITLPVVVFGFLANILPYSVPRVFFRKKVKDYAFLSTFNFAFGLVLFPVFYLAETSVIWVLSESWEAAVVCLLLFPLTGKFAFQWLLYYNNLFRSLWFSLFCSQLLNNLQAARDELVTTIRQVVSE